MSTTFVANHGRRHAGRGCRAHRAKLDPTAAPLLSRRVLVMSTVTHDASRVRILDDQLSSFRGTTDDLALLGARCLRARHVIESIASAPSAKNLLRAKDALRLLHAFERKEERQRRNGQNNAFSDSSGPSEGSPQSPDLPAPPPLAGLQLSSDGEDIVSGFANAVMPLRYADPLSMISTSDDERQPQSDTDSVFADLPPLTATALGSVEHPSSELAPAYSEPSHSPHLSISAAVAAHVHATSSRWADDEPTRHVVPVPRSRSESVASEPVAKRAVPHATKRDGSTKKRKAAESIDAMAIAIADACGLPLPRVPSEEPKATAASAVRKPSKRKTKPEKAAHTKRAPKRKEQVVQAFAVEDDQEEGVLLDSTAVEAVEPEKCKVFMLDSTAAAARLKPIPSSRNPSGFKGVYAARKGRWQAQVGHKSIGGFASAWEAGVAVAAYLMKRDYGFEAVEVPSAE